MKGGVEVHLEQILSAAEDACGFLEGMSRGDFLADKRTQQAVVMNLLIIGEIAARIMDHHPEFVTAHPQFPWRNMRGMRNRIAHGYFELDLGIVWDTVDSALPRLLRTIRQIGGPPETPPG